MFRGFWKLLFLSAQAGSKVLQRRDQGLKFVTDADQIADVPSYGRRLSWPSLEPLALIYPRLDCVPSPSRLLLVNLDTPMNKPIAQRRRGTD
ncbi:MAG: hypothetical protein LC799_30655, partial [Actinobacteria bacterium]|nr:hypothetical protein [Actinomycetota bacterium]